MFELLALLLLASAPFASLVLLQAAITASGLTRGSSVRLGDERWPSLADFVERFGEELGLRGEAHGPEPDPTSARFAGVLESGRTARVELARAAWGAPVVARASVGLDPREVAGARRLLGRPLGALARFSISALELAPRTSDGGKPSVELFARVPEERASAGELAAFLAELDALVARASERPRVTLVESEPASRCALCHSDLEVAPELLSGAEAAKCELCGTVLHRACWLDLGRCPALACSGRAPGLSFDAVRVTVPRETA